MKAMSPIEQALRALRRSIALETIRALEAPQPVGEREAPTLPVEIYGRLYDVPIAVQVHIVALESKLEALGASEAVAYQHLIAGHWEECSKTEHIGWLNSEHPERTRALCVASVSEAAPAAYISDDWWRALRRGKLAGMSALPFPGSRPLYAAPSAPTPSPDSACVHDWVSARNAVVASGEICRKCFALRAEESSGTLSSGSDKGTQA